MDEYTCYTCSVTLHPIMFYKRPDVICQFWGAVNFPPRFESKFLLPKKKSMTVVDIKQVVFKWSWKSRKSIMMTGNIFMKVVLIMMNILWYDCSFPRYSVRNILWSCLLETKSYKATIIKKYKNSQINLLTGVAGISLFGVSSFVVSAFL